MSGNSNGANPLAAASPPANPLLARCAQMLAGEPELAWSLAEVTDTDTFVDRLVAAARARGIVLGADERAALTQGRYPGFGARLSHWPAAARRGWQAIALEWGPQGAEFLWACGTPSAMPFHGQSAMTLRARPLNRLFGIATPLVDAFVADLAAHALPIGGLIFHMTFSGSTLVAQALGAWRGVRPLIEPALLDTSIMLARSGYDPHWRLLRATAAALAQPHGLEKTAVFKLGGWHALSLADIVSRIAAPWLFVYRNPVEVLASHRREPGWHTVPGMPPEAGPTTGQSAEPFAPDENAARVLGPICAAVAAHAQKASLLNYAELPDAIVARVAPLFGLRIEDLDRARLDAICAQHAKRPGETFVADGAAKRAAADDAMRECARRWVERPYLALEQIRTEER